MRRWTRQTASTAAALAVIPLASLGSPDPRAGRYQEAAVTDVAVAAPLDLAELRTQSFVIVHDAATAAPAAQLAALADPVLAGFTSAFSVTLPIPITVRLYASRAELLEAVPLAAEIDGILVTSPRAARELHMVAADGQPADNLRQALGRLAVTTLGAGAVPDLWASGFADFLTRPTDTRATGVARLRAAADAGQLHPWSTLGAAGGAFVDPSTTHPEALSAITFLAEQGGVSGLRAFMVEMGKGLAWPAAMQAAYGLGANDLETAWRAWLDDYVNGGWRRHLLYPSDASGLEQLLSQERYREATEGARAAGGFAGVDDPALGLALGDVAARAEARTGRRRGVAEAAAALEDGRYAEALALADAAAGSGPAGDLDAAAGSGPAGDQAAAGNGPAGDPAAAEAARELRRRAQMGLAAEADLAAADGAAWWQAPLAALRAVRARSAFEALGSEAGAQRAQERKARFDHLLTPLGAGLVALGAAVLGHNAWRRRLDGAP